MTREEIISMAREAGFESAKYGTYSTPGMYAYNMGIVERFAALVEARASAAEREACAKVCLDVYGIEAIRARGAA